MKLSGVLGLVCSLSILVGSTTSWAQGSSTVTKADIQGSLDHANTAATTQDLPGTLPGYAGDAPELQGLYSTTPEDMNANGALAGGANGQTGLMTASTTYKADNPIDPNSDWLKNALNIEIDPQGTTQGVGESTSSCQSQTQTSTSNTHSLYTCEEGTIVSTASYACSTTTTSASGYVCNRNWVDGKSPLVADTACTVLSGTSGCTQTSAVCTTASTFQSASYNCYVGNTYSSATSTCYANWVDGKTPLQPDATCTAKASDASCQKTGAVCVTASTYESASYNCYVGNSYSSATSTCGLTWVDGKSTLQPDAVCTAKAADSTCVKSGEVCKTPSTYQSASYNCYVGYTYSSTNQTCTTKHTYSGGTMYQYVAAHDLSGVLPDSGGDSSKSYWVFSPYDSGPDRAGALQGCIGGIGSNDGYDGVAWYCKTNGGFGNYYGQVYSDYNRFVAAGCTIVSRQNVTTGIVNSLYENITWQCSNKVGTGAYTTVNTYVDGGQTSTCAALAANSSCSVSGTTCSQTIDAGVAAYFGISPATCVNSTTTYSCTTKTAVNYCEAAPTGTGWSCAKGTVTYQSSGGVANAIAVTPYSCTKENGVNGCKAATDTYTCTTKTPVNYCDPAPSGTGWSCKVSGTTTQSSGGVANAITVTAHTCSKEDGINGCKKEQDTYTCTTITPVNYCDPAPTGSGWSCSISGSSYQASGGVANAIAVTGHACSKENGVNGCKVETDNYSCNNPVSGAGNATSYNETTNSAACNSYTSNGACVQTAKTCVKWNAVPANLQAQYGTQTCAQYNYTYDCQSQGAKSSDCEVPNTAGQVCTWTMDNCIGTDASGKCMTTEKVYDCVTSVTTNVTGQVCKASWSEGDLNIEATDDTENDFAKSAAAMNVLAEAAKSFRDSGNISIFSGKDLRCKKAVFGLYNCCKDSGVLLDINIVGCSSDEKKLMSEQKIKATHYIGTYCSNKSFFGTCLEKKMTYCGYGSVLSRIIVEAGFKQLNKSWGDAKTPNCGGFSIEEFQQLDLTDVDFADFYSTVMAKLVTPDTSGQAATVANTIQNMMTNKSPTK